jgi:hypothetical protein
VDFMRVALIALCGMSLIFAKPPAPAFAQEQKQDSQDFLSATMFGFVALFRGMFGGPKQGPKTVPKPSGSTKATGKAPDGHGGKILLPERQDTRVPRWPRDIPPRQKPNKAHPLKRTGEAVVNGARVGTDVIKDDQRPERCTPGSIPSPECRRRARGK